MTQEYCTRQGKRVVGDLRQNCLSRLIRLGNIPSAHPIFEQQWFGQASRQTGDSPTVNSINKGEQDHNILNVTHHPLVVMQNSGTTGRHRRYQRTGHFKHVTKFLESNSHGMNGCHVLPDRCSPVSIRLLAYDSSTTARICPATPVPVRDCSNYGPEQFNLFDQHSAQGIFPISYPMPLSR